MALDFQTYSKLYNALIPTIKDFNRAKITQTFVDFLRDSYVISQDRLCNSSFILSADYFMDFIRSREESIDILEKFIDELKVQVEKLEVTYKKCIDESLRVKEEEIKKKLEKKERKAQAWNTQKSTVSGKDKAGTSKRGRRPRKITKKEGKVSSSETMQEKSSATSNTGT